jgi:uncharacterized protein YgiM (DUF1202 family)
MVKDMALDVQKGRKVSVILFNKTDSWTSTKDISNEEVSVGGWDYTKC